MNARRILVALGGLGVAVSAVVAGSMVTAQALPPVPQDEPTIYNVVYETSDGGAVGCEIQAPKPPADPAPAHPAPAYPAPAHPVAVVGDLVEKNDEQAPAEMVDRLDAMLALVRPGSATECDRLAQAQHTTFSAMEAETGSWGYTP